MKIWKYDLNTGENLIQIPKQAQIVHVGKQGDYDFYLWAKVDPDAAVETRQFHVVETGEEFDPKLTFVGTILMSDTYVLHVLEETNL